MHNNAKAGTVEDRNPPILYFFKFSLKREITGYLHSIFSSHFPLDLR